MSDYTPIFSGGAFPFTMQAGGALTGGQLVIASTTAGQVTVAGAAAANVIGVAAHDAASGAKVTLWPIDGVTHEITSTGTIVAGDGIQAGASGVAATATIATAAAAGALLGIATSGATGGALVRFQGRG